MRTIALALALVLGGAGVASAAPRHHARAVKHAKLKRHSGAKHA
jgi:hypothetical protein